MVSSSLSFEELRHPCRFEFNSRRKELFSCSPEGSCTRSLMIDGKVYLPRSSHRAFLALAPLVRRRKHDG